MALLFAGNGAEMCIRDSSNCILNNLKSGTIAHKTNSAVTNELMTIPNMNSNFRKRCV